MRTTSSPAVASTSLDMDDSKNIVAGRVDPYLGNRRA